MGLFSFFNKKNGHTNGNGYGATIGSDLPDIPEETFIEKDSSTDGSQDNKPEPVTERNIDLLYKFLDQNHETKGYDDALVNPDISHLEQNVQALKNELERAIKKVKTFYEDFIKDVNFHIESRSRSGLIDTVEELKTKKEIAESHIEKIMVIEEDTRNDRGDSQGIIMSYSKGFKNGMAAISHHSILKRRL